MIPARNRERKCSTCKHYQPSPLWRKGWCRNPLLYDRNTNHLVEADSLACNRTFIDYWEPVDSSRVAKGAAGERPSKPRIAPSVPLEQVDRKGNRRMVGENTPATGMPVPQANRPGTNGATNTPPRQVLTLDPNRKRSPLDSFTEQEDDLLDEDMQWPSDPKATQQIEEVVGPEHIQREATGKQKTAKATKQRQPGQRRGAAAVLTRPLPYVRIPLWIALLLLAVVSIAAGGFLVLRARTGDNNVAVRPQPSVTVPIATATGFGDPTATAPPEPTTVATAVPTVNVPPAGVIGINGYIQVTSAQGLVVRAEPSTSGQRVTVMPNGSKAKIVEGPVEANGYKWWKVAEFNAQNPALTGWSVENFMTATTPP